MQLGYSPRRATRRSSAIIITPHAIGKDGTLDSPHMTNLDAQLLQIVLGSILKRGNVIVSIFNQRSAICISNFARYSQFSMEERVEAIATIGRLGG